MSKIILDVHGDDCALFSCWTLLREKPLVMVVFDSYVQPARGIPGTDAETRRAETIAACKVLGVPYQFLGFRDDQLPRMQDLLVRIDSYGADQIWAPAYEDDGHEHHNLVARACGAFKIEQSYLTYTRTRGKSTNGRKVPYEPEWVGLKFKALSCYQSQFQAATGCVEHFIARSLEEYVL